MFEIARHSFDLPESFVKQYKNKQPDWSGLGYFTYKRTYAREIIGENRTEEFWETCRRVVEGTFSIQKNHCLRHHLDWDERKAQRTAKRMFELMWNFRFLPPGRGLWMMGTDYIIKHGSAALQNCGFTSTQFVHESPVLWAEFLMDMSMVGVGVGFDTLGASKIKIQKPAKILMNPSYVDELYKLWNLNKIMEGTLDLSPFIFHIHDTREGWVASLRILLSCYFKGQPLPEFDYSKIRKAGLPIRGFGGMSSGPEPLIQMHQDLKALLDQDVNNYLSSTHIVDIGNMIGRCVVAGNVRRSSEIVFGDPDDKEFALLKQDKEKLRSYRWNSNNSIFARLGMDYSWHASQTSQNGEPGYQWMENARAYGRMNDAPNWKDKEAVGCNPCNEQTLHHMELCNLVETFPAKHDTLEEYLETLKIAYLYAKTVTLVPTHWKQTNAVMTRNRRIGLSQSGIMRAFAKHGRRSMLQWCDKGYEFIQGLDIQYSNWLGIPRSIKTTSVKPSGCRIKEGLVTTDKGIFTLEELLLEHPESQDWCQAQGLVAAGTNEQITKTYRNGPSSVVKIILNYNYELVSTPNHKWFVKNRHLGNGRYQTINDWIQADQISVSDVIDINTNIYDNSEAYHFMDIDKPQTVTENRGHTIIQPKVMDNNIAWLLGYLWGDGAMSVHKYRLRFSDEHVFNLQKANYILEKYFGISGNILPRSQSNSFALEIASKWLWEWCSQNNIWKYTHNGLNFIPPCVRYSSKSDIIAFFAGLIDSDGTVSCDSGFKTVCIDTAEDSLGKHLQEVGLCVGLTFGRSLEHKSKSFQPQKHMWKLTLNQNTTQQAFEFLIKNSNKMQKFHPNIQDWKCMKNSKNRWILGKVVGIEYIEDPIETFDIEVDNKHWYYAGAIKSHNTVSLLAGEPPGIHYPHSPYYIRRIRVSIHSPLWEIAKNAGYHVELAVGQEQSTMIINFPIEEKNFKKGKNDTTLWEQVANAVAYQKYWADNQVSCTVTFKPGEANDIQHALELFEDQLKGISFLPLEDHGYVQAPYETITKIQYEEMIKNLKPIDFSTLNKNSEAPRYCDSDQCEI